MIFFVVLEIYFDLGFHIVEEFKHKLCENETLGMTNSFFGCYSCLSKLEYVKSVQKNWTLNKRPEIFLRPTVRYPVDIPSIDQQAIDWVCILDQPKIV